MCDHKHSYPFTKLSDIRHDPDPYCCHVYAVHQDGTVFCQPDVPFNGETIGNTSETFCGDDRLTLIHLASGYVPTPQNMGESWPESIPDMPHFFEEKLKNICSHCNCKSSILWRNLHRTEHHFDACFRYFDEPHQEDHRCFLKLYTLTVPFLCGPRMAFSMVHHVRAEGKQFVTTGNTKGNNQEHMFAFISGIKSVHVGKLFADLIIRWQDIAQDHLKTSAGLTPKLLVAAILSQYGTIISPYMMETGQTLLQTLKDCDLKLQNSIENLKDEIPSGETSAHIRALSQTLIQMNIKLTGTRSTMHYLADSANMLVYGSTPFEKYVNARLDEWDNPNSGDLIVALRQLDSCKEQIRDNDKLLMVRKNMLQHKTDIKSLQQHIDINVGMVRNLIAERDRAIQLEIVTNTESDGYKMRIIAIMTILFLPATFMAILLTTPMFNWVDSTMPVIVRLPFEVYWATSGSITVLVGIILNFMDIPTWFCRLVDQLPLRAIRKTLQGTKLYRASKRTNQKKLKEAFQKANGIRTVKNNGGINVNGEETGVGKRISNHRRSSLLPQ